MKIESEELTTFTAKETPITGKIDILIEKDPEGYSYDHGEGDATLKGAVYKVDRLVLVNLEVFEKYLETFRLVEGGN